MLSQTISEKMNGLFTDDPALLHTYERNTLGCERKISGVFFPTTAKEVVDIVKLANAHRFTLYPISTGKNWGYGNATPVSDNAMIVDLSKMNQITHFDDTLGAITIEPGVTVEQLTRFLSERKANFICPINGAGPRTSIVGNILEKGSSVSGATVEMLKSLEVVLPNGDIYRNPLFSSHSNNIAEGYRWGVGPYLDGVFLQSSFGIVTSMTLALPPLPNRTGLFVIAIKQMEELQKVIVSANHINQLLGRNYYFSLHITNQLSYFNHNPSYFVQDVLHPKGTQFLVTGWFNAGTYQLHKHLKKEVLTTFKRNGLSLHYFDIKPSYVWEKLFHRFAFLKNVLPRLHDRYAFLTASRGMFIGQANEFRLISLYQYANIPLHFPLYPERDGVGIIWFATILLPNFESIKLFYEMANSVCPRFHFDPLVIMYFINANAIQALIGLVFDLSDVERVKASDACYTSLFKEGKKHGFYPSRIPISQMKEVIDKDEVYWQCVQKIKNVVDPNNIISCGRYS